MLFLTRWFGVTVSDAERNLAAEPSVINEIVENILLLQSAAEQKRPLSRGSHLKGTSVRAQFEVFDVTAERGPALAARLAKGIFATPGVYPAIVRFANSDISHINSDFKATFELYLSRLTSLETVRRFLRRMLADRTSPCTARRFSLQTTQLHFWRV